MEETRPDRTAMEETRPDRAAAEEARPDRLMTTSYSEICPFGGSGGSSGRSSALGCGSDTLLSPDLSPATPEQPAVPSEGAGRGSPLRPSAALLDELERDARRLAAAADGLIESLTGTMYSISSLAVDSMEAYRDAVCKTCDSVDANIKAMYQLMAKTEELNKAVKQVHPLAVQVRELKRLLELFEGAVVAGS
ncbi:BLOC-1-related complex subunit 6 [Amphibalanus amphitrite]|uniref:BLOC-1-related complex subunit 6 n=1 Tax=Amphibalanus amphitrite TaxID=1232801 RepID=A0A6A4WXG6_AMPAM|nr:BLOC-1-related complex subunit 6-like [Amphibalanus amphitrite]KAF0309979.1 BLOC-1-related complex subunit 6 [Amphibalanus amphitrite]